MSSESSFSDQSSRKNKSSKKERKSHKHKKIDKKLEKKKHKRKRRHSSDDCASSTDDVVLKKSKLVDQLCLLEKAWLPKSLQSIQENGVSNGLTVQASQYLNPLSTGVSGGGRDVVKAGKGWSRSNAVRTITNEQVFSSSCLDRIVQDAAFEERKKGYGDP